MADVLTHNIDQIVNRLTTLQRVDLPEASRRTMHLLGYQIARKDAPRYMKEVFENPNNFTQRSLTYKVVSNYEVQLSFKQNVPKGNDPARYLYPVTKGLPGNEAYQTKFTRYIHKAGIAPRNLYPVPFKQNLSKTPTARFPRVSTPRSGQGCRPQKVLARLVAASGTSRSPTTATVQASLLVKEASLTCQTAFIA